MNDIDKNIYKKIIKRSRYGSGGIISKIALSPKVLIYILFLGIKNKGNHKGFSDLKNLENHDFFTYESISVANKITMITSQQTFMLLKIFYSKIARNENRAFQLFILLLAGDIETNLGEICADNGLLPHNKF